MTLKKLIELLQTIALSKPNIRYADNGNVYDLNSKPDVEFCTFFVTQMGSEVYENQAYHKLALFYIDRLTDNFDNRLQVQSDGQREITNIINTLLDMEDVEVKYPLAFTSFNERFSDECAGVFTTVTFITDLETGICSYE